MIEQLYTKHKIFFLKQIKNSSVCWNILTFLRGNYDKFNQKNTSFCKQLNNVEKKTHIDVLDYSLKISLAIIDHLFIEENRGLVDSVKFIVSQIKIKYGIKPNLL